MASGASRGFKCQFVVTLLKALRDKELCIEKLDVVVVVLLNLMKGFKIMR